jgi:hypothetical protein
MVHSFTISNHERSVIRVFGAFVISEAKDNPPVLAHRSTERKASALRSSIFRMTAQQEFRFRYRADSASAEKLVVDSVTMFSHLLKSIVISL